MFNVLYYSTSDGSSPIFNHLQLQFSPLFASISSSNFVRLGNDSPAEVLCVYVLFYSCDKTSEIIMITVNFIYSAPFSSTKCFTKEKRKKQTVGVALPLTVVSVTQLYLAKVC